MTARKAPADDVAADDVPTSLADRARRAYAERTAKPTNDVPVLADTDTGEPFLWLRLGIPGEAQTTMVRQMLLDQSEGRVATPVSTHAAFVGACVQALGEEDPERPGEIISVKTAAGTPVSWVPWVADVTGIPCASAAQAVVALFTATDSDGGPPRLDTQRLAEVSDMHRMAVLADTQEARKAATAPGA